MLLEYLHVMELSISMQIYIYNQSTFVTFSYTVKIK